MELLKLNKIKQNLDQQLKEVFIKVFDDKGIDFNSCEEKNYEKWDSLRGVNLLLEVEKFFKINISNDELVKFNSFQNIKNLLEGKIK